MQTQCPSCRSVFRVSHQQLSAAGGLVRCGKCSVIFNGSENIKRLRSDGPLDPAPAKTSTAMGPGQAASSVIREQKPADQAVTGRQGSPVMLQLKEHRLAKAPPEPAQAEPSTVSVGTHGPVDFDFGLARTRHSRRRLLRAGTLILALALVLTGAYGYYARERLIEHPMIAEWAGMICSLLGCELSPRRDLERIEIIGRNVFTPPGRANVLRITATLANKARFPQPHPLMQVSFTNLQGTVVARHRFTPGEYLPPDADADALMRPNLPVKASVEIPDPGAGATAYEFALYALPD